MRIGIVGAVLAAMTLGTAANAVQLVTNGTFDAGLTGYATQYSGTDDSGYQYLAMNPHDVCGCFASIVGDGNQLVLDGAGNGTNYFFQETFAAQANKNYTFSFDAANLGNAGPQPDIAVYLNGSLLIDTGALSYSDTYQTFTKTVKPGASSVTLTLVDTTPTHQYNDFAVDNISFKGPAAVVPEPASWALFVVGFGLIGASVRRRGAAARFA